MVFETQNGDVAVIGTYIDVNSNPNAPAKRNNRKHMSSRQAAAGVPSAMLDTVFASVGEIAQPGTKTTTGPLVMSEVVNALTAGQFQT